MLGLLKHTFTDRGANLWKKLYTSYVRPHLEFAVPVWNPHRREDIRALEGVQHRATKIPQSMKCHDYEKRCELFGLTTLEVRRARGDMIQHFKFEKSIEEVNWVSAPHRIPARGINREKLSCESIKNRSERRNFYTNRVVDHWNQLPNQVIESASVNQFKSTLDEFIKNNNSVFCKNQSMYLDILYSD